MIPSKEPPLGGVRAYIRVASLKHNIQSIRNMCPDSKVMAIIKANAYGHGLEHTADALAPSVDGFGVARIEEAIRIRNFGIKKIPILVMSAVKSTELFHECVRYDLDVVVQHEREIELLGALTDAHQLRVWLKMNCGLQRLGLAPQHYASALKRVRAMPQVRSVTAMTHFSRSSDTDPQTTLAELQIFNEHLCGQITSSSTANSGAICRFPESHLDWVRPGLLIYGVNPAPELLPQLSLRVAMSFCAPIIAIQEVAKGKAVGYGGWWRAPRKSKIALIGAGYADGYPCYDADKSVEAFLNGLRVPLVGQVSMDILAADITECPNAQLDDLVELWGENISVNEVAKRSGRRLYTLLTGIGERVPRIYT